MKTAEEVKTLKALINIWEKGILKDKPFKKLLKKQTEEVIKTLE